jgi:hypothetical protein
MVTGWNFYMEMTMNRVTELEEFYIDRLLWFHNASALLSWILAGEDLIELLQRATFSLDKKAVNEA